MKQTSKKWWLVFLVMLGAGVLLHFLYEWLPCTATALVSPVNESLWEHVKIVFYPLAAGALWMAGGDGASRAAWLLSAVIVSLAMLGVAYVYHILLGGTAMAFDLTLYGLSILAGFLLPRALWRAGQCTGGRALAWVLALAMTAALVWFTFAPPDCVLFYDLSDAARTFYTIPV